MTPEQIAELLKKAVEGALNKTVEKPADVSSQAIADLAKAVTGINTRLETLDKTVVKQEPETVESQVGKLSKTVTDLAGLVAKIASGEKIEPNKDEPMDFSKMTQEKFDTLVATAAKSFAKSDETPDGEGKEDIASLLKQIAAGKDVQDEIDIELDGIEMEDVAGNKLSNKSRSSRKDLDNFFGKKLGNMQERILGSSDQKTEDEDSDEDED